MSFLNRPWSWDKREAEGVPVTLSVVQWRRGPITFYMHRTSIHNEDDFFTEWIAEVLGVAHIGKAIKCEECSQSEKKRSEDS